MPTLDRRSILKVALVGAIVSFVAWFYASGAYEGFDPESMRTWIRGAGVWGGIAFVLVYSCLQPLGVNGLIFLLSAPLIWEPTRAFVLNWIGTVGCALVSFAIARFVARDWVQSRLPTRARRFDERLHTHGFRTVLLLRIVFFTSPVLQYALGVSRVRARPFLLGTVLGVAPFTALITILGVSINAWLDEHPIASWPWSRIGPIVVIVAVGIAAIGIFVMRRLRARSVDALAD